MKKLFAISLLILAGCAPQISVYNDTDPDYDLWTYKTFDWSEKTNIEENKNPLYYNELNDKRIKSAVASEMKHKGYQMTDSQPELIIHYHIVVQDQMALVTEPYGYSYTPYWIRSRTNVYPYKEGSLIIDIMDANSKNLIWRGWAVSPIETSYSPEQTEKLIKLAVTKIFRRFPGKAKPQVILQECVFELMRNEKQILCLEIFHRLRSNKCSALRQLDE
jgi:hypothetical protein